MRRQSSVEIESLGTIYRGPWEKKYWSSSRGKDRYPYPVGYRATRKEGGHTYNMEIRTGARGPLFVIRSGEIECFGPTLNSAWEAIMKAQHGGNKRHYSSINGAEMFGFTDAVVQHLLRGLLSSGNEETKSKVEEEKVPSNENEGKCNEVPSVIRKRVLSKPHNQELTSVNKRGKKSESSSPSSEDCKHQSVDEANKNDEHYVSDSEPEDDNTKLKSLIQYVPDSIEPEDEGARHADMFMGNQANELRDTTIVCKTSSSEGAATNQPNLNLANEPQDSPIFSNQSDSPGEEITRCMLSVLLPTAVPLMKKDSGIRTENDSRILEEDSLNELENEQKDDFHRQQVDITAPEDFALSLERHNSTGDEHYSSLKESKTNDGQLTSSELLQAVAEIEHQKPEKEPCPNFEGFKPVNRQLTSSELLQPIIAIEHPEPVEHPQPVIYVVLNLKGQEMDLCVCCGSLDYSRIHLYIYRLYVMQDLQTDAKFIQSFYLESSLKVPVDNGIQFTLDNEYLLLLGCFSFPDTKLTAQSNIVRLVPLNKSKEDYKLELVADTILRCILVSESNSVLAAGDRGYLKEWVTDLTWRHCREETVLPSATYKGTPFRRITRLLAVPKSVQLVIGSDNDGSFAMWDISKRQLLSTWHTSEYSFLKFHVVDVSLVNGVKDPIICLLAEVVESREYRSFWRIVALENEDLFVGNKTSDRICAGAVMGRYGVAGTDDGRVFVFEFSTGRTVVEMLEQDSRIVHVGTTPAAGVLVTVGKDGRVILYI